MTNRKNTKRALFASAISMLLCVTMLVGSTFAWFTDNASTAVSSIVAGTLDIELLDGNTDAANSLEGKTLTFTKADGAPGGEVVLFEPGARYSLTQVYLHNAGNLHAKYQVTITGIDGSSLLAKVLDVYVDGQKQGTLADLLANGGIINASTIAPGEYYTFGTIELEMQTTAGNEYQGLTMDGIAITVQATQAAVEYDSNNNQYDAGAEYDEFVVVETQEELNAAVAKAPENQAVTISLTAGTFDMPTGDIMNNKDITFAGTNETKITFENLTTQYKMSYAHNSNIAFEGVTVDFGSGNYTGIAHAAKVTYKDCVLNGQQTLYASTTIFNNCTFNADGNYYAVWTWGSTDVNFSNCAFNTAGKAILVYNDGEVHTNVGVNGCTFNDDNSVDVKKGAVEVGSSPYSTDTTHNIYIRDCTVNGFAVNDEGTSTGSTAWGNKNSMDKDHLNVVIDGVDVY